MPNNNGIISAPVGWTSDIKKVLGSQYNEIGALARDSHINKWSKIKPVNIGKNVAVKIRSDRISIVNPFTNANEQMPAYYGSTSVEDKYVATSIGNVLVHFTEICGLKIPEVMVNNYAAACAVIDSFATNGANWPHVPLADGNAARAADFDGYDHYARSQFYFWMSQDMFYANEKPYFGYDINAEGNTSVSLNDFIDYFKGYKFYVLIKSSSGTYSQVTNGEDFDGTGISGAGTIIWDIYPTTGTYQAYFVLWNQSKERIMLLPNIDGVCNNPITFKVNREMANPETNPFLKLGMNIFFNGYFGYSRTQPYLERFINVGEGDYVYLCTTGSYYFEVELYNATNTSISITMSSLAITWDAHKVNGRSATLGHSAFKNGVAVGGTVTFSAGERARLGLLITDVYHDTASGQTMSVVQGQFYGTTDRAHIMYGSAEIDTFDIQVIYDAQHNGQFYSASVPGGYFTSR